MNQTLRFGAIRAAAFALLLLGCSEVHAQVGGNLNGGGSGKTPTSTCGDSSHALSWDNSAKTYGCQSITGSAAAGGSTTQVQRNNGGALGGISGVISDGVKMTFSAAALELSGSTSGTVVLNAPATGGGTLTLPQGTTTLAAASNNLSFFSSTTSAQLATLLSDETGSGAAVFGTSPTIASPTFSGTVAGAGTIPNTVLVNSAMTLCGTSTSLGGSLTASACLDGIGSTRGSVLYRGVAGWAALTPGTSGDCLKSQGAGADPVYGGCGGGSVSLTTSSPGLVFSPSTLTGTGTIDLTVARNTQTGTSYAWQTSDAGKIVSASNGSAQAYTIAVASTTGFTAGFGSELACLGAGTVTLTATTSTFDNGLNAVTCTKGQDIYFWSDSTNYHSAVTMPVIATSTLLGNSSGSSNYPTAQTVGANVLTAMGNALSASGGLTTTVVSGTSALGTSAISSGACASAVTTTATGTATTDVIMAGFNGDPTGVTGYAPATAGMLTIISYPSANNVNFKVCNNTSSSVTPGAITLNWRVVR